ncbi:hypothetical protein T492DRAFT_1100412 [Pavlovales sp. CCMP2436]|nr:hypothetical protein T492DRAFT_1100412 [Pavlovales sp. CCMP2436]|mmetsp:Transcript_45032/g.111583  ORF Transcript_45032/g.111583 Transcript_45032/m.111583 type:complete len:198 (-) Transcript_45032:167-760(-)|eukprot:CAMPEP_0179879554 /NCGR_PEP_ID=MMETSP0982-20121206/26282_1 /TAXON_ID=483367 /ORGANISM="non described non described, Strain CCMP 2436" /LENGTH=197 /DNA_ID=CAMNT_0021773021 /DNA_START=99 /DNA_END=692 /DNA_ORIENTATION=+
MAHPADGERPNRCPLCPDTFDSAWERDQHFDYFHMVLEITLLGSVGDHMGNLSAIRPAGPQSGAGPPAKRARQPPPPRVMRAGGGESKAILGEGARDNQPIANAPGNISRGAVRKPMHAPSMQRKPCQDIRSNHMYIYCDVTTTKKWFAVLGNRVTGDGRWRSHNVATEAEALSLYATEAERRGISPTVPPLRASAE